MRVLGMIMLAGILLPPGAGAWPVPPPPEGFPGGQYIDGAGCVFVREGADWSARRDAQGRGLCGFPPSLGARRTDPGAERVLPLTAAPAAAPDATTLLVEQVSRDLRPGEWAADPAPAEIRAEPAPSRRPDPMQTAIRDAVTMAPALREAAGLGGSDALCARLGYIPDPQAGRIGSTAGLCPGMRPPTEVAGVTRLPRETAPAPTAAPPRARRTTASGPARTVAHTAAVARQPARRASPPAATATATATVAGPEMIAASARYVQVGAYGDDAAAAAALRAIAARGYPAAQGRAGRDGAPLRLILAGPFPDRQGLVAALNDLRRNGFSGAVAR